MVSYDSTGSVYFLDDYVQDISLEINNIISIFDDNKIDDIVTDELFKGGNLIVERIYINYLIQVNFKLAELSVYSSYLIPIIDKESDKVIAESLFENFVNDFFKNAKEKIRGYLLKKYNVDINYLILDNPIIF